MENKIIFYTDYVRIILIGEAEYEGMRQYVEDLVNRPEWRKGFPVLLDFRQLNLNKLRDPTTIQSWYSMLKTFEGKLGRIRNASLINGFDLDVYVSITINLAEIVRLPLENQIFTNEAEALNWLIDK